MKHIITCNIIDVCMIIIICCILKTVSHRHCNNNIADVEQEVMLHMQHILPQETKLTMSLVLVSSMVFCIFQSNTSSSA